MGLPRLMWRYRASLAAVAALALAIVAERLMRQSPDGSDAGLHLMQVAVVLVGPIAWARRGTALFPAGGCTGSRRPSKVRRFFPPVVLRLLIRMRAARERLGIRGIVLGLGVTGVLALCLLTVLLRDFSNPLAPPLWLLTLAALLLTFAGTTPLGRSRVEDEPAEPSVSRTEWLTIGVILLVAAALRLWSLETIPTGPFTDEGDRALDARHINRGEPFNGGQFIFFGTGWWGVPSIYFWLVAQSMKLFGDSLAGARMVHALAGIATVWFTYRLGRLAWSPRVGLLAAALLAVSDFAIQFSRTAGESTITLFAWTVCFYYLFKATKTCRPIDWALAGVWGGFTLLGYASGKLLPPFLLLAGVFLLLRWGSRGARIYLPGLALMALALALTYGPNGLYALEHPDTFSMRYNTVSIFTSAYSPQVFAQWHTHNWLVILLHQFGVTFSAFDTGSDHGPFYPTGDPILPTIWGALWVLGAAYTVWRIADARYALLGVWLLAGLAGAATTTDTPTVQRTAGMAPLLALLPAIFLVGVVDVLPDRRLPRLRAPSRRLFLLGSWALVAVLAVQCLTFYFGSWTPFHEWESYSIGGRYAHTLDPARDTVYQADLPDMSWTIGATQFLADRVTGRDLTNPSADLPIWDNGGETAHFLVFPNNGEYLQTIRLYYPGGRETFLHDSGGALFATDYIVDARMLSERRRAEATYTATGGSPIHRLEGRLGTGAGPQRLPTSLTYPVRARWTGGLVAPAYGAYRLQLLAPAGAVLRLDARAVLSARGRRAAETSLVLARGVHSVQLTGTLRSARDPIDLRWGATTGSLLPVSRRFLWSGPHGTLLGQVYRKMPAGALTSSRLPSSGAPLARAERDGLLGFHALNTTVAEGPNAFAVWRGELHARTSGTYLIDQAANGSRVSVFLDGRLVGTTLPGATQQLPAAVPLSAGVHAIELRVEASEYSQPFELYWRPPDGARELLPPTALLPARGGVWTHPEQPQVPGIPQGLLDYTLHS